MRQAYRTLLSSRGEPFAAELKVEEIMKTEGVLAVDDRQDYTVGLGAMVLMTGEMGGGKSTGLRFALSRLHPSEYRLFWVTPRGVDPGTLSPDRLGTE
jgi:hypothetical protein